MTIRLDDLLPKVLPARWTEVGVAPWEFPCPTRKFVNRVDDLSLIASLEKRSGNAGLWFHCSLASPTRLPSWKFLRDAKELFMGDRLCVQILPPRAHYLNVHPNCLHLFHRLDADTLPPEVWMDP